MCDEPGGHEIDCDAEATTQHKRRENNTKQSTYRSKTGAPVALWAQDEHMTTPPTFEGKITSGGQPTLAKDCLFMNHNSAVSQSVNCRRVGEVHGGERKQTSKHHVQS